MWRKPASPRNSRNSDRRYVMKRWVACGLGLIAALTYGQASDPLTIEHEDTTMLQVFEDVAADVSITPLGTELRLERFENAFRFTATHDRVTTRSSWFQTGQDEPWVVYSSTDHRFHEVDNRVKLKLNDSAQLDAIASEVKAADHEHYQGLGYAVLWLAPEQNPVQVVKQLRKDPRVQQADIEFKRPIKFPQ